ncbi:MAG TPA: methionyl-tRNA formyltransferase [Candidatus Acidoferrales bacterium]|nr:methionyl-tRNA formyltransferase [Candidatus Acidoferrales bacterium]
MKTQRVIFFGTPEFAVPSLEMLLRGPEEVVGVVCQPDRPAGRGQHLTQPPVKQTAVAAGIPVLQPTKVRTPDFLEALRAWTPDLIIVAAYGRILPTSVLELPEHGCINVHASLLPKYRGAAPIQWSLINGDTQTGVTIMQMSEEMDAGDILLQHATDIGPEETYGELQTRLGRLGAQTLRAALDELSAGRLRRTPQDPALVTMAPMIKKEDGRIDWQLPAAVLACRVRGFNPWPSATTTLNGKLLKIHRAHATSGGTGESGGTVVSIVGGIGIACGDGILIIDELQLEGRKPLAAAQFVRGGTVGVGTRLG